MNYPYEDKKEDNTDVFCEKYKSNSVNHNKPRHTLGGKITIMK